MRVLLSTIGSRGDVQPLVALATQLRALGQDVHLCVPPDFREWIEGLGMSVTSIGPELRKATAAGPPPKMAMPSPEQRRQMVEATVATQFETIQSAAEGCDLMVGATALQIAAPSVAEKLGVPYVFAGYCPTVLPSTHHGPPPLSMLGQKPASPDADHPALWAEHAEFTNTTWREPLNAHRFGVGLGPVEDVRVHIFTAQPWLAADEVLAPWPDPEDEGVVQTGAWLLPDQRPLARELEAFLEAGEPPVYFGFGSMRAPEDLSAVMVRSARALGRRAVVSRGWADLSLLDQERDCLAIGEVNQQALFPRVAAVVHHGGAGTTTVAALAGAPQVIIPQMYDQHYWASRIQELAVGVAHAPGAPTLESLTAALEHTLDPVVAARAGVVGPRIFRGGALFAAKRLLRML